MPLKIRVKPEAKIFAGGAVLKNVGRRPAELLVLSDGPVLREDYMMNVERRDESDVANVYFLLQVIYLFKGKGQPLDDLVVKTLRGFSAIYPSLAGQVDEIVRHLEAGEAFKALRLGHKLLADHAAGDGKSAAASSSSSSSLPQSEAEPVCAPSALGAAPLAS